MNCYPNEPDAREHTICAPFKGPYSHFTNCSELAEACYDGYVASPKVMADDGMQKFYIGGIRDWMEFKECAKNATGNGRWFGGMDYTAGCEIKSASDVPATTNSTDDGQKRVCNAAYSKHSVKSKGTMLFSYVVIALTMMTCFSMAGASGISQVHHRHHGRHRAATLTKVGHGSWDNITWHAEYLAQLGHGSYGASDGAIASKLDKRTIDCNTCEVNFWDQAGCKGNLYHYTATEKSVDEDDCNMPFGHRSCNDPNLTQSKAEMWVSSALPGSNSEAVITVDQSCGDGPTALTTIKPNKGCAYLGTITGNEGLMCYSNGGVPLRRRNWFTNIFKHHDSPPPPAPDAPPAPPAPAQENTCHGFRVDRQYDMQTPSVQIGPTVDCRNEHSDCTTTTSSSETKTIETTFNATAGVSAGLPIAIGKLLPFKFSASVSFGRDYTDSLTTTVSNGFTVKAGEMGYLSASGDMTVFEGTFTDCDDKVDRSGTVHAVKAGKVFHRIVYTN
ncbi:hypothetical protein PSEUBRA_003800 [Kalmanozyma brasiliensis GHG001]|uniref:uncharacterized protein n=1 Tax=Kalmanozyma brasiliensis (strain GHG001) TaxID=1365824 RepID=UPI001CEA2395|nr:uncharacterized protein PSEUBRA_003800 [Kalmanozyma brasiliensis GHG001]KAF6767289.1 hypothetical protein PSEUBRA_003800 [Kalmanozyma brasiliensis GHG001]